MSASEQRYAGVKAVCSVSPGDFLPVSHPNMVKNTAVESAYNQQGGYWGAIILIKYALRCYVCSG